MLDSRYDVAEASGKRAAILMRPTERHRDFQLIALAEDLLIDELIADVCRPPGVDRGSQHRLAFRKGFFGGQSAWHVQFTTGPVFLGAQAAHVGDDLIDLTRTQDAAEGRHDLRKPASGAAIADYRSPVPRVFRGRLVTSIEMRERIGLDETRCGFRCALTIGTMTGGAGRLINFSSRMKAELLWDVFRVRPPRCGEQRNEKKGPRSDGEWEAKLTTASM